MTAGGKLIFKNTADANILLQAEIIFIANGGLLQVRVEHDVNISATRQLRFACMTSPSAQNCKTRLCLPCESCDAYE